MSATSMVFPTTLSCSSCERVGTRRRRCRQFRDVKLHFCKFNFLIAGWYASLRQRSNKPEFPKGRFLRERWRMECGREGGSDCHLDSSFRNEMGSGFWHMPLGTFRAFWSFRILFVVIESRSLLMVPAILADILSQTLLTKLEYSLRRLPRILSRGSLYTVLSAACTTHNSCINFHILTQE